MQVLELLDSSPTEENRELLLAASAIVNAFLTHCPVSAQLHLTRVLLEPLMVLAGGGRGEGGEGLGIHRFMSGMCAVALSPLSAMAAADCVPERGQVSEVEMATCWKRLSVVCDAQT